jgi:hypothetical protein
MLNNCYTVPNTPRFFAWYVACAGSIHLPGHEGVLGHQGSTDAKCMQWQGKGSRENTSGFALSRAHRPRKACSFSTSSRMLRSALHQGPTKCTRWGAICPGDTHATRPSVIALQPKEVLSYRRSFRHGAVWLGHTYCQTWEIDISGLYLMKALFPTLGQHVLRHASQECTAQGAGREPHLFSTMERGMEFMFCRMGTRRSTIAAAKGPKSSGFNFIASSPEHPTHVTSSCPCYALQKGNTVCPLAASC